MTNSPHEDEYQISISELRFNIFDPIKEPLGALVIHFADLEASVTQTINTFMGIFGPMGQTLHSLMPNFSSRIELFHNLAIMHAASYSELEKPIISIVSRLKSLNPKRNNFLHDPWTSAIINIAPEKSSFGKKRYKADGGQLREVPKMTGIQPKDIWDTVDEAYRLALTIYRWRIQYIERDNPSFSLPSLPDISQQRSPLGHQIPD